MRNSRGKSHGDHEDGSRTDLRVIKTKRAITGTLIELLRTKSIGKITVTELAQKAEINKGTFYLHYEDIYDLYQEALQGHLEEIVDKLEFLNLFAVDPDRFARELVAIAVNRSLFEGDPFFDSHNAVFNQSVPVYFCNALTWKIMSVNNIPATKENEIRLRFMLAGASFVLRHHPAEDGEAIASVIASAIKESFLKELKLDTHADQLCSWLHE